MPLALTRAAETVPTETRCAGGCRYEIKWDEFRAAIVCSDTAARLWSRRDHDLTSAFPDLAAAATVHLQPGTVLDGEAVILTDGRLSFEALQQRLAHRGHRAAPPGPPASYVAFDLLAQDGQDLRELTYDQRRQRSRTSLPGGPRPSSCARARPAETRLRWYEDYRLAGIEGLVIKSGAGRYPAGRTDWIKVKNRQTREVIVGAITGSIDRPEAVIAGAYREGELLIIGRTVTLTPGQAAELARHLTSAAADQHPWPEEIGSGMFGQRQRVRLVKVRPLVVLEVAADAAQHLGRYQHPLRYVRIRTDVQPSDVGLP